MVWSPDGNFQKKQTESLLRLRAKVPWLARRMHQPHGLLGGTSSGWKLMRRHSSALQKRPSRPQTSSGLRLPLQCYRHLWPHRVHQALAPSSSLNPLASEAWSLGLPFLGIFFLQFFSQGPPSRHYKPVTTCLTHSATVSGPFPTQVLPSPFFHLTSS